MPKPKHTASATRLAARLPTLVATLVVWLAGAALADPFVADVSPRIVPAHGGEQLLITGGGWGLDPGAVSVSIGPTRCIFQGPQFGHTSISCLAMPGPAGVHQLRVEVAGVSSNPVPITYVPPNIVIVVADDYGFEVHDDPLLAMPALDSIRSRGVELRSLYSYPRCKPGRAALLTGRHASHTWVHGNASPLSNDELFLPEALGLSTSDLYDKSTYGKLGLSLNTFEDDVDVSAAYFGFNHSIATTTANAGYESRQNHVVSANNTGTPTGAAVVSSSRYHTFEVGDNVIARMESVPAPHFVLANYLAVHTPVHVYPSLSCPHGDLEACRRDMAQRIDAQIQRVLDSPSFDIDRDVIIFLGDNGTDISSCKSTVNECGIRVPAIIGGGPILYRENPVKDVVSIVDIFPTVVDLALVDRALLPEYYANRPGDNRYNGQPFELHGSSLKCFLTGKTSRAPDCSTSSILTPYAYSSAGYTRALITADKIKYVQVGDRDEEHCFALRFDPDESTDLWSLGNEKCLSARATLEALELAGGNGRGIAAPTLAPLPTKLLVAFLGGLAMMAAARLRAPMARR